MNKFVIPIMNFLSWIGLFISISIPSIIFLLWLLSGFDNFAITLQVFDVQLDMVKLSEMPK